MIRSGGKFSTILDSSMSTLSAYFQEDPIKTELTMLMTKLNRGFFSNQWDVSQRLIIHYGHVLNSSENSHMSTLSASFRKID